MYQKARYESVHTDSSRHGTLHILRGTHGEPESVTLETVQRVRIEDITNRESECSLYANLAGDPCLLRDDRQSRPTRVPWPGQTLSRRSHLSGGRTQSRHHPSRPSSVETMGSRERRERKKEDRLGPVLTKKGGSLRETWERKAFSFE